MNRIQITQKPKSSAEESLRYQKTWWNDATTMVKEHVSSKEDIGYARCRGDTVRECP